ncbi:MAG: hypothetical protein AAFN41_11990 [Planctomycetota bacterium]
MVRITVRSIVVIVLSCFLAVSAHADGRPVLWHLGAMLANSARVVEAEVVSVRRGSDRPIRWDGPAGVAELRVRHVYKGDMTHERFVVNEIPFRVGCFGPGLRFEPGARVLIGLAGAEHEGVSSHGRLVIPPALGNGTSCVALPGRVHSESERALVEALVEVANGPGPEARVAEETIARILGGLGRQTTTVKRLLLGASTGRLVALSDAHVEVLADFALFARHEPAIVWQWSNVGTALGLLRERELIHLYVPRVVVLADHADIGLRLHARAALRWFADAHELDYDQNKGGWEQVDDVTRLLEAAEAAGRR